MHANTGDRIVIKGHLLGQPDRDGEVLEVHGPDGAPPYLVRWSDTGHESLFFPGPDAWIKHFGEMPSRGGAPPRVVRPRRRPHIAPHA